MRRVLMIAYYFPPAEGMGSVRAAGFARHLPQTGWEPVVLAPVGTPHDRGEALPETPATVVRARSFEPSAFGRRATGRVFPAREGPGGTLPPRLRAAAHRWLYFPDAQLGWWPGATRKALHLTSRHRFDAIYSSSFPVTAHLVAAAVKRRTGLPWLAEFRDPWALSIPPDAGRARWARSIEHRLVAAADAVATVSPTWAVWFGEVWGRPFEVIPNGHGGANPGRLPEAFVVTYVGSYYPRVQDLTPIWRALAELRREGRLSSALRVRLVGEPSDHLRRELSDVGLDDVLEVSGPVSPRRAIHLMEESSLLVAAGSRDHRDVCERGRIAGKLFEYLATGLPVLYLGSPSSDAAQALAGHPGCWVVGHEDDAEIKRVLTREPVVAERKLLSSSRAARTATLARVLDDSVMERRVNSARRGG